jgi:hypothetical protein
MNLFYHAVLNLAREIVHFLLACKVFIKIALKMFGILYNKRFRMLSSEWNSFQSCKNLIVSNLHLLTH